MGGEGGGRVREERLSKRNSGRKSREPGSERGSTTGWQGGKGDGKFSRASREGSIDR